MPPTADAHTASPARALLLPVTAGVALAAYLLIPGVTNQPAVAYTFAGAALLLLGWAAFLFVETRRTGRPIHVTVVLRQPHYIQLMAQGSVLLYWGWYVRSVYAYAPFILAQIIFAYGFDALLQWSRRNEYQLGAGPFPVIFSISLFLWFRLDWFFFQFAMVAAVFLGKEFLRWNRDGRSRHIFNPSAFALALASLLLIVTGSTDITFGLEIASTQNNPPHIFLAIFLAAIPGQILFGVTTMTMSAVVTTYLIGLVFYWITGTYFFYDAFIPIAVFLGMHLLFTDPSTAPRSEVGRAIFGMLYGVGVVVLAALFDAVGVPTFYDKLLPVPILNLMVRWIDGVAESPTVAGVREWAPSRWPKPRQRLAMVGLWVLIFAGMSSVDAVGDHHPGQYLPFWAEACENGSDRGCEYLAVMEQNYCDRGSGWACNELGVLLAARFNRMGAVDEFRRACELGYQPGCANVQRVASGTVQLARGEPPVRELPIVLRGSKGPVDVTSEDELFGLACRTGWRATCARWQGVGSAPVGDPVS